ncbi:MAG: TM2 domain-containing protein [Melioribacter sp.]|nr:TM2 domain-containing protein [Melioribacter sp.]
MTYQIGIGILYLLTCGICFIGTILDLVNYRRIAFEYNQKQAEQILQILKNQ